MMDPQVAEELTALAAIYCQEGEFEAIPQYQGNRLDGVMVVIQPRSAGVRMTFSCDATYPKSAPSVSVQAKSLKKSDEYHVKTVITERAVASRGQPMILELCSLVLENVERLRNTTCESRSEFNEGPSKVPTIMVMHIDHMRNRTLYCKNLTRLANENNARLLCLFFKSFIFLVAVGDKEDVKAFMRQYKTQNIDVDSAGSPCKERMLTVLAELQISTLGVSSAGLECVTVNGSEGIETQLCSRGFDYVFPVIQDFCNKRH